MMSNSSNFAALQAAIQRNYYQPSRIHIPQTHLLTAAQEASLVDPLSGPAREVLLDWAQAVTGKVDPTQTIEEQLSSLQKDFSSRLHAIAAAIEPVREVAQRTLDSLTQAPTTDAEPSPVVSTSEVEFIAIVVLFAAAFMATVVGDDRVGGALTILATLLTLRRNHKTEG
jgi:hypothetical protein